MTSQHNPILFDMKKSIVLLTLLMGCSWTVFSQVLLEDKQGEQIANNLPIFGTTTARTSLIKINTGDQSLGFSYIISSKNFDPSHYHISEFGVKAKPTDGTAAIFSSGQFSPGIKFNYALAQVKLFADNADYLDWGGLTAGYAIDKYNLFNGKDTVFSSQIYNKSFKGLSIGFNYNALIKSKWIINLRAGYARANNYEDMSSVSLQDITSSTDPTGLITRQTIITKTAKEGAYKEYDSYPMIFALTKATATDTAGTPKAGQLRLGYTIYLKNKVGGGLPKTNAGLLFFLTKQDKTGIRAPILGLDIQASDPFDINKVNNGLQNRLSVSLTTIFTL